MAIGSPLSLESTVSNGIVSGIRTETNGGCSIRVIRKVDKRVCKSQRRFRMAAAVAPFSTEQDK